VSQRPGRSAIDRPRGTNRWLFSVWPTIRGDEARTEAREFEPFADIKCRLRGLRAPYFMFPRSLLVDWPESAAARRLLAARDFCELPRVGREGFGHSLAIDELSVAPAGNQPGFAENFEMVRNGCRSHAPHGRRSGHSSCDRLPRWRERS